MLLDFTQKVINQDFGLVDLLLLELFADVAAVDIFLYFA